MTRGKTAQNIAKALSFLIGLLSRIATFWAKQITWFIDVIGGQNMRCLCLQVILFASTAIGTSYLQGQISETEGKCSGSRGKVAAIHDDSVAVKNDDGALVFRVNADTKIWRGSSIRLNQLHLGDDVIVQCVTNQSGGATATDILANFTRWAGTITAVHPRSIVIVGGGGPGEATGHVEVLLDVHTTFAQGTPKDLKVGRDVEVSGLDLGHKRVQASALNIWPSK